MFTQPKLLIRLKTILLFVFLVFLSFGITYGIKILSFAIVGEKLEAKVTTVINTEKELGIIYSYSINNKIYEGKTHNFNDKYKLGDKISVFVKESKPEESIIISRSLPLVIIDFLIFIPAVLIVLLPLIKYYKYCNKVKNAMNSKIVKSAIILDVLPDYDNEKYEVVPLQIICTVDDNTYSSPYYYIDYKRFEELIGETIDIYFDHDFYYIDPLSIKRISNNE